MRLLALALLVSLPLSAQTRGTGAAEARERGASVPAETALLLEGKPFPAPPERPPRMPGARRTFFVAPGTEDSVHGDGSEARPWNDLAAALRALEPGDRLRVRPGKYASPISIDASCRDGKPSAPIQVVFDGKAVLQPPESGPSLTIRRAHWRILGAYAELGDSEAGGVELDSGARDVALDGTRVSGGRGPGVRVGSGVSGATIRGSRISKERVPEPSAESVGIQILGGSIGVVLSGNHLNHNPAGSLRVEAPGPGEKPARDVLIAGNTIRDDDSTAIRVSAAEVVRVIGNTLSDQAGRRDTRGIVLERVTHAVVRSNHLSRFALAMQIGRAEAGVPASRADDVVVDHNVLENAPRSGTAVAIEAANRTRFVHNVVSDYANGVLVLGRPPETKDLLVANDLFFGVSETALLIPDEAAVPEFDYNIFAPAGVAWIEVGGKREPLVRWVRSRLPHSSVAPRAFIAERDLARVEGVPVVDRGRRIEGLNYIGAAPDIGVAER